jgi:hypothetical protein
MAVVSRNNQLHIDKHAVVGAPHTSFKNICHAERVCDLA